MLDVCQVSWTGSFRCLIVSLYNFKWYFKQIIHMNRGQWLGMNFNSRKASTVPICLNIWYANIWKWKKYERQYFSYINQNKFDISFLQMCYFTQKYNWIVYVFRSCTAASGGCGDLHQRHMKRVQRRACPNHKRKWHDEVLNSLSMRLSAVEAIKKTLHRDVERLNNN